ncbi:7TM diverse intracellular signaling domain-containing protein [uncultured Polaribacter sp.]|uniref:7TM diverse intracellular signaling domain-containing protein n=1 Tax=uncultured Polaribacter sp. TaxID=174711 RepID=UPI0026060F1F|nr:7TM diverse intracellular signaling domain-containing protein [uncultured Polaribacter sp.]
MCFLCFQNTFTSNFEQKTDTLKYSYTLSFFKESKPLAPKNVLLQTFKTFPASKSFGYKNGNYWIKVELDNNQKNEDFIAYIPTHQIKKIDIFKEDNNQLQFKTSTGNSIQKKQLEIDYQYPTFKLKAFKNKKNTYYLYVSFPKETNFPIKIINENEFVNYVIKKSAFNNLYYGTSVIIILLNIFLFFKFREKTYLFYFLFLTSLLFKLLLIDGYLINNFRGNDNYYYLELIIHFFNEIWFLLFSISFLNIYKRYPKFTKLLFILPILVLFFYIIYLITKNYFFVALSDSIGICLFPILWFVGLINIKKIPHAIFYVIGYLLIIPFAIYFIIGFPFGLWEVRGDMKIIKIACWLDIIVFTYAISYRMKKKLEIANKNTLELQQLIDQKTTHSEINNKNIDPFFALLTDHEILSKPLTLREIEVLKLLILGHSNAVISDQLFISLNTLKSHIRNIYLKTGVKSRKELKEKILPLIS